jgi:lysophospholipase L1-like esterase
VSLPTRIGRAAIATAVASIMSGCGGGPTNPTPPPLPAPNPAPLLTCPSDVRVDSRDGQPVAVSFDTATAAGGNPPIEVRCEPGSGATFPVGDTEVTCAASDSRFQTAMCRFRVSVVPPPRVALTRFLAFGDSLTEGKIALTPTLLSEVFEDAYSLRLQRLLAARYTTQQIVVVNDAVGGERVVGITEHSPGGDVRLSQSLNAHRPEVLLLMEGSNDLGAGRDGSRRAIDGLQQMVRQAKGRGVRVFLATVPPIRSGGARRRDATAALVPEFNDSIRALAARESVTLVDVYGAMKDRIDLIGQDDLHLTPQGYAIVAEIFFEVIKASLEVRTSAGVR